MDQRREPIFLETDRYRIEGKLTLPREGFRSRLSDYVNQGERDFFSIEDAAVTPLDGSREAQQVGFMLVARRHVRLVMPSRTRARDSDALGHARASGVDEAADHPAAHVDLGMPQGAEREAPLG